jgi:hypothetical protein
MPDLLTPEEAAAYLWEHHRMRRSPRRLQDLRMTGEGPEYFRDGNVVRYPRRGLDDYAHEQYGEAARSTAEEAARRQRVTA